MVAWNIFKVEEILTKMCLYEPDIKQAQNVTLIFAASPEQN